LIRVVLIQSQKIHGRRRKYKSGRATRRKKPEGHFTITKKANRIPLPKLQECTKTGFLDYASYVILERAVPAIEDGFKPVQRRIMHSLKNWMTDVIIR
jgi:hypothetical protein